jgi:hypothetical protein
MMSDSGKTSRTVLHNIFITRRPYVGPRWSRLHSAVVEAHDLLRASRMCLCRTSCSCEALETILNPVKMCPFLNNLATHR